MNHRNATTWAVAVMVVAGTAGIVGLAAVGDKDAANLLPLLIGFLAPTITGLMAAQRSEAAAKASDENANRLEIIHGQLNGELDKRIEAAVDRALSRWTAPPGGSAK